MNFCLHISEVLSVRWTELDFTEMVYFSKRRKNGIRRVAVVWEATKTAFMSIPRSQGRIFKSSRGCVYHANSLRRIFTALRQRAGVPDTVKFDSLRDGAYTAAFVPGVDPVFAMAVAGHRLPGEMDKYILRHPEIVKPACDAIAKRYACSLTKLAGAASAA